MGGVWDIGGEGGVVSGLVMCGGLRFGVCSSLCLYGGVE